ncbi:MAG: hypothetical protein IJC16_02215 [Rikenellaceae bacterium]|nr:hypothetical protein [Rikenellaceae bacterium]
MAQEVARPAVRVRLALLCLLLLALSGAAARGVARSSDAAVRHDGAMPLHDSTAWSDPVPLYDSAGRPAAAPSGDSSARSAAAASPDGTPLHDTLPSGASLRDRAVRSADIPPSDSAARPAAPSPAGPAPAPPHGAPQPASPAPAASGADARDGGKRLVDFRADELRHIKVGDSSAMVLLRNVVLYHNGAVITCDSAVRYSENYMECFRNVIVNKDSVYVYGDRADYVGSQNSARVFAPLIKVVDGDATLYTYQFSFDTKNNVGRYGGGGTLSQGDNLMESREGYYYGDRREVVGVHEVEIRNPEYRLRSDSVGYNLDTETAMFYSRSYIWNEKGEILSADDGAYDRAAGVYTFTNNAYVLTADQEIWADMLVYNGTSGDALLRRNIQVLDEEHKVMAFGDMGRYWGRLENGLLTERPSIINYDPGQPDTLYMCSDSMFLYTVSRFAAEQIDSLAAVTEQELTLPGPGQPETDTVIVREGAVRDSAGRVDRPGVVVEEELPETTAVETEEELDLGQQTEVPALTRDAKRRRKAEAKRLKQLTREAARGRAGVPADPGARPGSDRAAADSLPVSETTLPPHEQAGQTLVPAYTDTVVLVHDSPRRVLRADSLARYEAVQADSAAVAEADSLLLPQGPLTHADSVCRVVRAYRNVKIYRSDFQAVCDSLVAFSLDSTIHMYIEPLLWNGANQIKSDVVDIYTERRRLTKAVFTGGPPLMSSRVDSTNRDDATARFNQIRGKVIEAYFRNNEIYHTFVNGNAEAYYYMQDDSTHAVKGFLVLESGNISFYIENQEVTTIVPRNKPVYGLYPLDKIPDDLPERMPNFVWQIDRKPTRAEVFDRTIRPSQREEYEALPQTTFPITAAIDEARRRLTEEGVWYDRSEQISSLAADFIRSRPPADTPLTP